jgi:hypothetical protein
MPANDLANVVDKTYPDYAYTAKPLVAIYDSLKGKKVVANLLIGEWVKILDKPIPDEGRINVRFRGGTGYVLPENLTRSRFLEIFFIDVDQGDSVLIQTPDDREGRLKKYGGSEQVYEKSLHGVVHLRSDGKSLYLGTVHGRKAPDDPQAATCYKWDIWPPEDKKRG